ncbi:hypothetical protein FE697_008340 [Mumia zhuanghuii]|uniref:Glycosyltransferase RgtA/B/C/D-like domain-containing protein n=2 Tax=Mumia TaxID=1546255 RepID=A0ABW1QIS7_9ACTN|nr:MULTISPECIES: hypothetical protein [Mumia]KAA1423594.1 hypothetical protein FE697_008340 [Mumia zhuanghuii]
MQATRRRGAVAPRVVLRWLESGRWSVLAAVLALATLFRLPYAWAPLSSDEGGFLLVAHQWVTTEGSLYGNQWVDRPPGLLIVFRAADVLSEALGDRLALRLVALALVVVAVVAAWFAGGVVAGSRGAVAAALTLTALTSTPVFSGPRLTTGLPGVALVAVGVACALSATYDARGRRGRALLAAAAGAAGASALLMKQNYADGLVFALVLWTVAGARGRRLILPGAAGAAVPLLATLWWAATGPGVGAVWEALYGFREQALSVILSSSTVAPAERALTFALAVVASGAALLAGVTVWTIVRERRHAVAIATLALLGWAVFGIVGGGSWWRHYALQLAVPLALGAALAVRSGLLRTVRVAIALSLVSTLVAVAWLTPALVRGWPSSGTAAGEWIHDHASPGDSGLVAYGSPQVLRVGGLAAPYEYSWSLPTRVRDPDLVEMTAVLSGADAPEWLVEMGSFTWWGIDTDAFRSVVASRYREVADVCGHRIYLRIDVRRDIAGPTRWCPDLFGRTTGSS